MCVTHSAIQNSKLGPGESRNSKRGPPGYAQLFCFYPPYSSRVRGAAEAQARRGTRGISCVRARDSDGPCADRLRRVRSEGTRGVCGRRVRGALSFGSLLWVRKVRTPSYGGGCAGESQASGGRLARRTGRPRRVCPGLPSAAGKRSAGRQAQDLQARARRAERRKPVRE